MKKLHFRTSDNAELVPLEGPQHELIAKLLLNLLSADTKAIFDDFTVQTGSRKKNESAASIELIPDNNILKKAITRISIRKKADNNINIELFDNLSQRTTINLYDMEEVVNPTSINLAELCSRFLPDSASVCEVLTDPEWRSISDENF